MERYGLPMALLAGLILALIFGEFGFPPRLHGVPDAVEYAVSSVRLSTIASYDIAINEATFPPRYPPGLAIIELPFLWLFGPSIENTKILMSFSLLGCVLGIALLSNRRSFAPLLAVGLFFLQPGMGAVCGEVLTEIPTIALWLATFLFFRAYDKAPQRNYLFSAAIIIGLATMLRPPNCCLLLPWVFRLRKSPNQIALFIFPSLAVLAFFMGYNQIAFGSIFRSGYNFWVPMPYDFPELIFSLAAIPANLIVLKNATFIPIFSLLLIAIVITNDQFRSQNRAELFFLTAACLPLLIFHLFYFYPNFRFYLPIGALLIPIVVNGIIASKPASWGSSIELYLSLVVILAALPWSVGLGSVGTTANKRAPNRLAHARELQKIVPTAATLISGLDAVLLSAVLEGQKITALPWSRNAEYASKMIAPKPLQWNGRYPSEEEGTQHRGDFLSAAGAVDVFPAVANEIIPQLQKEIRAKDKIVVFDFFTMGKKDRNEIQQNFKLQEITKDVFLAVN